MITTGLAEYLQAQAPLNGVNLREIVSDFGSKQIAGTIILSSQDSPVQFGGVSKVVTSFVQVSFLFNNPADKPAIRDFMTDALNGFHGVLGGKKVMSLRVDVDGQDRDDQTKKDLDTYTLTILHMR